MNIVSDHLQSSNVMIVGLAKSGNTDLAMQAIQQRTTGTVPQFVELLQGGHFQFAIEYQKKDTSLGQELLQAGFSLFIEYLQNPKTALIGLYFLKLFKPQNIPDQEQIFAGLQILYENVKQCRNPIQILLLMSELASQDMKKLYIRTAIKLEKNMSKNYGSQYCQLLMDCDLTNRDVIELISDWNAETMYNSKSLNNYIHFKWVGPYNVTYFPFMLSFIFSYFKVPGKFLATKTEFKPEHETTFFLTFKNFYMSTAVRFFLLLFWDIFICVMSMVQVVGGIKASNDDFIDYLEDGNPPEEYENDKFKDTYQYRIQLLALWSFLQSSTIFLNLAYCFMIREFPGPRVIGIWIINLVCAGLGITFVDYLSSDKWAQDIDERESVLYIGSLWIICLGVRILFLLQLTKTFGVMVILIFRMVMSSAVFGVILCSVIFLFSAFFYLVHFRQFSWTNTYGACLLYMFHGMLGAYELEYDDEFSITSTTVWVLYLTLTFIIMLNLLIAILSDTYSKVYTQAKRERINAHIQFGKFTEIDANYSILTVIFNPFSVLALILIPAIYKSKKFAQLSSYAFMYLQYIVIILPLTVVYFLVCDAILFLPCYIVGIVVTIVLKDWKRLIIWLFLGPFILLFELARGLLHCIKKCLEFPDRNFVERKILHESFPMPNMSNTFQAETISSPTNRKDTELEISPTYNKPFNTVEDSFVPQNSFEDSIVIETTTKKRLYVRPELYNEHIVEITLNQIQRKEQRDSDFGGIRMEFKNLRHEFGDVRSEVSDLRDEFGDLRNEISGLKNLILQSIVKDKNEKEDN